jgi:hypothetical protein
MLQSAADAPDIQEALRMPPLDVADETPPFGYQPIEQEDTDDEDVAVREDNLLWMSSLAEPLPVFALRRDSRAYHLNASSQREAASGTSESISAAEVNAASPPDRAQGVRAPVESASDQGSSETDPPDAVHALMSVLGADTAMIPSEAPSDRESPGLDPSAPAAPAPGRFVTGIVAEGGMTDSYRSDTPVWHSGEALDPPQPADIIEDFLEGGIGAYYMSP